MKFLILPWKLCLRFYQKINDRICPLGPPATTELTAVSSARDQYFSSLQSKLGAFICALHFLSNVPACPILFRTWYLKRVQFVVCLTYMIPKGLLKNNIRFIIKTHSYKLQRWKWVGFFSVFFVWGGGWGVRGICRVG